MKFIDFLKDRIAYIIVYFISISLVILIMHLTLFIKVIDFPITNILYAYFVSIVILIIFLLYEYSKVRVFYKQTYRALNSKDIIEDIVNISEVRTREQNFYRVIKKLHKSYESKIYKYEDIQKHYSNFINQWVHQMKTPVSVINLILEEENLCECKEVFDSIGEENEKYHKGLILCYIMQE